MRVRLTHSFIIILVSFTFLSEVFRLLIAPSGQVDPEARGLREYISNSGSREIWRRHSKTGFKGAYGREIPRDLHNAQIRKLNA